MEEKKDNILPCGHPIPVGYQVGDDCLACGRLQAIAERRYWLVYAGDGEVIDIEAIEAIDAYPADPYGRWYIVRAPDRELARQAIEALDAGRDLPEACKLRGVRVLDEAGAHYCLSGGRDGI